MFHSELIAKMDSEKDKEELVMWGEIDRQTDRQADRQTDRYRRRQTDKDREREKKKKKKEGIERTMDREAHILDEDWNKIKSNVPESHNSVLAVGEVCKAYYFRLKREY